jgi:hypothetical protein
MNYQNHAYFTSIIILVATYVYYSPKSFNEIIRITLKMLFFESYFILFMYYLYKEKNIDTGNALITILIFLMIIMTLVLIVKLILFVKFLISYFSSPTRSRIIVSDNEDVSIN